MKKQIILASMAATITFGDVYTLGQVNVQTKTADQINMFEKSITSTDIEQNNERTITEALDDVSGISSSSIGARGESTVSIRGFDAKRIGVFIDGVPVGVPYDGNFDFNRFLTNDISEIDVSKGYSSVVYGANTMGGVINIVSKKPTKELEGNLRGELIIDNEGSLVRHLESINIGSKIDNFYAQLSGSYTKRDHYRLSDDYTPVAGSEQPKGDRLRSESQDKKINLKLGYITDDASEIAINYINQQGEKQQPLSVDDDLATVRYWDWPYWDKEMISLSALKNFESSYIKALTYYDISQNSLYSYADNTYSSFNNFGYTFKSRYDDYSYGARLEYGLETGDNFLKLAANYKKDVHRGYDIEKFTSGETLSEKFEGHTISVGIEDNYKITKDLEVLGAISYDQLKADKVFYPGGYDGLDTISAVNPQAAVVYTLTPTSKLRGSISQKSYLPSMKDRYSGGLGTKVANPDLKSEQTTHYELSYAYQVQKYSLNANFYISDVNDAIEGVATSQTYTKKGNTYYKEQNQNVGDFRHKGFELDMAYKTEATQIGGNYAYIDVENRNNNDVKRTGIPKNQIFAYAQQAVGAGFSLYANMRFRDGVYEQNSDGNYVKMSSFTTFDTKVIFQAMKSFVIEMGVKNITDELVEYDIGFPDAGREYFATLNYKF